MLEWIWFIGFGILALYGERYVIWFIYILTIQSAILLTDWEQRFIRDPKPGSPLANWVLALLLVIVPLFLLPGARERWWSTSPPSTENTPILATQWLSTHAELPGPLWSEIGFSSYLEYALPERPTWIDTRFEVFTVEQWQAYQDISYASHEWQKCLDETSANLLMISIQNQPKLLSALADSPGWCEKYRDSIAVIYWRCGGY